MGLSISRELGPIARSDAIRPGFFPDTFAAIEPT
jgi:hypothetical protein